MLLLIMGKTASGKDTVCNLLCEKYGFERIVTYTTRPMRKGEVNGKTYHFVTDDEFLALEENGFFLETKTYSSAFGEWRYGSPLREMKDGRKNKVLVLTPSGIENFLRSEKNGMVTANHKIVYIYANNATIKKRLVKRGDKTEEATRRIAADEKDFKDAMNLADRIVYNNEGVSAVDVARRIMEMLKKKPCNA